MAMCQCGIFCNCNGSCDFCLIENSNFANMDVICEQLVATSKNIDFIAEQEDNWTNKFRDGISLLGGELFYIMDERYKELFMKLIDKVIDKVIKPSDNPLIKFSTVTNGFYDPESLLFPVIDKLRDSVGLQHVDVNFSYDFKYRFKTPEQEKRVRDTINAFHERYNYRTGIQMILTQDLINKILYEGWRPSRWIEETLPGNQLALLYPHPIHRGNKFSGEKNLDGFNFTRDSLFEALKILKEEEPIIYEAFISSCQHSAVYKYTMLYDKDLDEHQAPRLSDGKEIINPKCGHSILYQCYSDTDKCMMCDLEAMEI
jgi:hypothetical protein